MKIQNIMALVAMCFLSMGLHGAIQTQTFLEGNMTVDTLLRYIIEAGIYNEPNRNYGADAREFMTTPPRTNLSEAEKKDISNTPCRGWSPSYSLFEDLKEFMVDWKRKLFLPVPGLGDKPMTQKVATF